jgi:hypothetical protein
MSWAVVSDSSKLFFHAYIHFTQIAKNQILRILPSNDGSVIQLSGGQTDVRSVKTAGEYTRSQNLRRLSTSLFSL